MLKSHPPPEIQFKNEFSVLTCRRVWSCSQQQQQYNRRPHCQFTSSFRNIPFVSTRQQKTGFINSLMFDLTECISRRNASFLTKPSRQTLLQSDLGAPGLICVFTVKAGLGGITVARTVEKEPHNHMRNVKFHMLDHETHSSVNKRNNFQINVLQMWTLLSCAILINTLTVLRYFDLYLYATTSQSGNYYNVDLYLLCRLISTQNTW